ncbi:hypothetical protein RJT34_12526 [Clitoria ternatea]|uniref:Uncharacterized protein n=1 Tax=Clitoria ternatea TaxID=43366 RepID=A0AAN9PKK7_CLITE
MIIRQVQYRNPDASLKINVINPYHEFHDGKLFTMVNDELREPKDVPYWLVELSKLQSTTVQPGSLTSTYQVPPSGSGMVSKENKSSPLIRAK